MPTVDSTGHVQMSSTNWFVRSIAVASDAQGQPGSLIAMQRALGRDPSGDILSYYASGSQGIRAALVDTVRLESSREQLELEAVLPAPSAPRSIQNFDYGMGIIAIDPRNRAGVRGPVGAHGVGRIAALRRNGTAGPFQGIRCRARTPRPSGPSRSTGARARGTARRRAAANSRAAADFFDFG